MFNVCLRTVGVLHAALHPMQAQNDADAQRTTADNAAFWPGVAASFGLYVPQQRRDLLAVSKE